jgi:hypothetical protein
VLIILLLVLSTYELLQIDSLLSSNNQLQAENSDLNAELSNLQSEFNNLQSQVSSSKTATGKASSQPIIIQGACLSSSTNCNGTYSYIVGIYNNTTETFNSGYSIYLSFYDNSTGSVYPFNTSLPGTLTPNSQLDIKALVWPLNTRPAYGDTITLTVLVQGFASKVEFRVQ